MSPRLAFALEAVHRAGQATLAHFNTGVEVLTKEDDSPVTVADREAERILRSAIATAFPGEAIIGEEEGASGSGDRRWIIDPIDGTKSFIRGVPLYGVLLAYEEAGQAQLGVAYFPALCEMVHAERGHGCFLNGRPSRVSDIAEPAQAVVCCAGHKGMDVSGLTNTVTRISMEVLATRTWCDAYGHALVATGRAEAMVDPVLQYWDIVPMALIVTEAGGYARTIPSAPTPGLSLVSTNRAFHAYLSEALPI